MRSLPSPFLSSHKEGRIGAVRSVAPRFLFERWWVIKQERTSLIEGVVTQDTETEAVKRLAGFTHGAAHFESHFAQHAGLYSDGSPSSPERSAAFSSRV